MPHRQVLSLDDANDGPQRHASLSCMADLYHKENIYHFVLHPVMSSCHIWENNTFILRDRLDNCNKIEILEIT